MNSLTKININFCYTNIPQKYFPLELYSALVSSNKTAPFGLIFRRFVPVFSHLVENYLVVCLFFVTFVVIQ